MLSSLKLEDLLFIDIETVPAVPAFAQLEPALQEHWAKKARTMAKAECDPAELFERAGLHAEFGQIICVSIGVLRKIGDKQYGMRLKSFCNENEHDLLVELSYLLETKFNGRQHCLCGHNIRDFDIPYLCRRMLINDICIPKLVDCTGLKPWEISHLDTMQLWKFGDQRSYISLDLLATLFKIPSPKADISGADVARVFYEERDLARISQYCQRDVLTVAQLLLRFKSLPLIKEEDVEWV